MSDCVCDFDEPAQIYSQTVRSAKAAHRCHECFTCISVGARYEDVAMLFEGKWSHRKTCHRCLDLREWVQAHIPCFCWTHGSVLHDAKETVQQYAHAAPGLFMGWARRQIAIDRAMKLG